MNGAEPILQFVQKRIVVLIIISSIGIGTVQIIGPAKSQLAAAAYPYTGYATSTIITSKVSNAAQLSSLALQPSEAPLPTDCTGGNIQHVGSTTIHTFSYSDTLSCPSTRQATVVVVGGGGGGGGRNNESACGGAGGGYSESNVSLAQTTYTVTVGRGGPHGQPFLWDGFNGEDSWFDSPSTLFAKGGEGAGNGPCDNTSNAKGGSATLGIGTIKNSGGNGGISNDPGGVNGFGGGGGGGSGGHITAGGQGGTGTSGPTGGAGGTAGVPNGGAGGAGGSTLDGFAGFSPGGGGGGAGSTQTLLGTRGGDGASGVIIVSYPPKPPPTASRQIVFVHGIKASFRDIEQESGEFQSLIRALRGYPRTVLHYYQDSGYQVQGGCSADSPSELQANTNIGTLYAHPESIDPNICDSQSAIAYDSTRLDDMLSNLQSQSSAPVTVIAYSMGAAAARGWMALAQSNPNDHTLSTVDSLITIQGVQQGSFWAGAYLTEANIAAVTPSWQNLLWYALLVGVNEKFGIDASRPAVSDFVPQSQWYQKVNPISVPQNLHYYNFYSNIKTKVYAQFLDVVFNNPLGTVSSGDNVLLPGDSNPATIPLFGGSRFLPSGPSTDRHEYEISSEHTALLGDDILTSLIFNGVAAAGILNDPISHFNLNQHVDDAAHTISSCKDSVGQITIQDEILRILANPAQSCD